MAEQQPLRLIFSLVFSTCKSGPSSSYEVPFASSFRIKLFQDTLSYTTSSSCLHKSQKLKDNRANISKRLDGQHNLILEINSF